MFEALLIAALLAQTPPGPEATIAAIDVQGNTRTARDVVVGALGVRPGDRIDDDSLAVMRQRLLNLRLFQDVEVTKRPSDAGLVLSVAVKEKWTLIPIPIFGASSGAAQAGLALFESNLLGRRKLIAVSAIYSSRGQSGFVYYRDPSLRDTTRPPPASPASWQTETRSWTRSRWVDVPDRGAYGRKGCGRSEP